jgi:hypothetical protein
VEADRKQSAAARRHQHRARQRSRHGKAILRDYIKAIAGFEKLGAATDTQPKSLIRMFGKRGNPQARNLFGIIGYLQKHARTYIQGPGRQGSKRAALSA